MKEACLNARRSIDIEQYILEHDEIGREFLEILIQKKQEGVAVRILCDMVGSRTLFASAVPNALRDAGIDLRFFNVIKPWRLRNILSWFFRDHRKITIIDRTVGFIGGVGIREDMSAWRDTHLKVSGNVVQEMSAAFEMMWEASKAEYFPTRKRQIPQVTEPFHLLTNAPTLGERFLYRAFLAAIREAKYSISITTPYFIPDRRLRKALRGAARRGVRVRILVPERSNHPWVDLASHSCFEGLLKAGVELFMYTGEMLHAKTCVIDDQWSMIGSFNLDSLSFFYNYEANIASIDPSFSKEVSRFFEEDMALAHPLTLEAWRARPRLRRFKEWFMLPCRRIL